MIAAATNLQSHSTSNVVQHRAGGRARGRQRRLEAVAVMRDAFARRGQMMYELLSGIPGVSCLEPQGAFYCFPSFVGVLGPRDRRPHSARHARAVRDLLDVAKVAIVPGEAFGAPGYARLSFALGDDDLGEGVRRIADLPGSARKSRPVASSAHGTARPRQRTARRSRPRSDDRGRSRRRRADRALGPEALLRRGRPVPPRS